MISAVKTIVLVLVKLDALALASVISPAANPVTASENVNVAVNGASLALGTPLIVTLGAVLSRT